MAPPTLIVAITVLEGQGEQRRRGRRARRPYGPSCSPLPTSDSRPPTPVSRRHRLRQTDRGTDQIRLSQCRSSQLTSDRALVHHQRPVAETDDLGKISREEENTVPLARQATHQLVDLL